MHNTAVGTAAYCITILDDEPNSDNMNRFTLNRFNCDAHQEKIPNYIR